MLSTSRPDKAADFIQACEQARANDQNVDLAPLLALRGAALHADLDGPLPIQEQERSAAQDEPLGEQPERTVWNNGRIAVRQTGLQADAQALAAAVKEGVTTARVVVHIQRPEELGSASASSPQAVGQNVRVTLTPTHVDQPHVDEVAEVGPILITERRQLDLDEGREVKDAERPGVFRAQGRKRKGERRKSQAWLRNTSSRRSAAR